MSASRSFLSVIAWPDGWSRDMNTALIAEATRLDEQTVKLRLGAPPPMIVGLLDESVANRAAARIEEEGGLAFAPSIEAIEALGPTIKIRDMRLFDGRLHLDLWRREPTSIDINSIEVIIRGRRSETTRRDVDPVNPFVSTLDAARSPLMRRSTLSGAYGLSFGLYSWHQALPPPGMVGDGGVWASARQTRISHMIDLHTPDAGVFQIDANKFGFQVLGEKRGQGDLVNTDRLCEMLAGLSPGVTVDPYFSLWRAPVELSRVRIAEAKRNGEDPEFAFYSRWSALLYRYVKGRELPGVGEG